MKFKTWAQSALHFLKVKGQDENTSVLSAASWRQGPAQKQTQGLFNQKPAKDWGFQEWVQAMQDALFQIYPMLESRMWLHEVRLTDAKDFPKFAHDFKDHMALIESDSEKMAKQDQINCFKRALHGTSYYNLT